MDEDITFSVSWVLSGVISTSSERGSRGRAAACRVYEEAHWGLHHRVAWKMSLNGGDGWVWKGSNKKSNISKKKSKINEYVLKRSGGESTSSSDVMSLCESFTLALNYKLSGEPELQIVLEPLPATWAPDKWSIRGECFCQTPRLPHISSQWRVTLEAGGRVISVSHPFSPPSKTITNMKAFSLKINHICLFNGMLVPLPGIYNHLPAMCLRRLSFSCGDKVVSGSVSILTSALQPPLFSVDFCSTLTEQGPTGRSPSTSTHTDSQLVHLISQRHL